MRVVVTGATGNVGTSVVEALSAEPAVDHVIGLALRRCALDVEGVEWRVSHVLDDDLVGHFRGADAVVHLAWLIQPNRDLDRLRAVNVDGSARVFRPAAEAGVPAIVYASSVGAYSPGRKDRLVDETWPTDGVEASFYARHKSAVERLLDGFEREHPGVRVVRLRKALVFRRQAASEIHRYFLGRLVPRRLVRPSLVPVMPTSRRLVFQVVHSVDAGDAYRRALLSDVRGAFNIAADPVLERADVGRLLRARPVRVPEAVLRAGAAATWRARLQPTSPGWVDLALAAPLMDTSRARVELGWTPRHRAEDTVGELLEGIRHGVGMDTPPLAPRGGPAVPPAVPARA